MVNYKSQILALLKSIETGDASAISCINPAKYIQHNLGVADGIEGFGAVLQALPKGSAKANVVRAFQEDDFVFTHTEYNFFGPKIGFDIFRFEDGKVVEHWDNMIETALTTVSGRSQTDGETQATDLEKTKTNKEIIKDFYNAIFINGKFEKIGQYFNGDTYLQHNPMVPDGVSGLMKTMQSLAAQGASFSITKLHKVLGEGNFVLTVGEGAMGTQAMTYYDLFRLENDKVVEHWDVIEPLMPKEQWKNTNGKF